MPQPAGRYGVPPELFERRARGTRYSGRLREGIPRSRKRISRE